LLLPWAREAFHFDAKDSKIGALNEIRQKVKSDPQLDGDVVASDIVRQLGLEEVRSSDDPLDKKLSWRQLQDWVAPGFIVGGHGHTHAILSFLTPSRLAWELDTSLTLLRERGGICTSHYSYPEGLAHCCSHDVIAALKGRGIACCPTAMDGINPPAVDPFHLRRVMVG
jgi:hypothetical protein